MAMISSLLEPIAGENPAGANLRYDPIYDRIKQARTEDDDVPQGDWQIERKTADYPLVIKLASEVLATRSKDLQIGAWLTEALLRRQGFAGLTEGLELLHDLLDGFWEHLYPELEDDDAEFRAVPLEWIANYLDVAVKSVPLDDRGHNFFQYKESRRVPPEEETEFDDDKKAARNNALSEGKLTPEEFDAGFGETSKSWYKDQVANLDASLTALAALDEIGSAKFGDAAPNYMVLRQSLEEVRQVAGQLLKRKLEIEPDPPEEVTDEAPAPGEPEATSSGADATPSGGNAAAAPVSGAEAAGGVAAAARFMRAENPTNPAPYLMLRGYRWGELRVRGEDIDPKLLVAPATEVRTRLKTLLLDEQWADLLASAEEVMAMPAGRGWLDLQRYVLTACDGLGSEYDFVAAAVRSALAALLRDLPALTTLTLMDDSPTANPETMAWLETEGIIGEAQQAGANPDGGTRQRARRGTTERAMELVKAGQPQAAVDILMREAAKEGSSRSAFLRRSEAASVMVDAGVHAVAMPLLTELVEQIDQHQLERWEDGETIARPLGLLYLCMQKLEGEESGQDLYLRICRLDPLQAIRLGSQTNGRSGD